MSYQKFFNPEESYSRSELEALQLERLQATVKHCMNSPFYKERFRKAGLTPSDIRTLARRTRLHKPTIEAFLNAFCEAGLTEADGEDEKRRFSVTF